MIKKSLHLTNNFVVPKENNPWAGAILALGGVFIVVTLVLIIGGVVLLFQKKDRMQVLQKIVKKEYNQLPSATYTFKNDKEKQLFDKFTTAQTAEESITYIKEAIDMNPSAHNYYYLGLVQFQIGNKDQAKESFISALKKDPKHFETLSYYGYVTGIKSGFDQFQEGKKMLEEAISIDSSYSRAYYYLALLYGEQEDYSKAKYYIEQAAALEPENKNFQKLKEDIDLILL
jgi:cytochrome c-type biogenesis protein CcmH/NrfG